MGFDDFLGGIGSIFSAIASWLGQLFALLWNSMLSFFVFLWNNLVALFNWIWARLQTVGRFFSRFWTDYVKKGITGLVRLYERIRQRLERIFGPVIRWLQKAREWFDKHIYPVLKKYLNLIQRIRRVLRVLAAFNLEWAKKLDARLARIESKIADAISTIRGKLNEIISLLELLVNPAGLIRATALGRSILAVFSELSDALGISGYFTHTKIELLSAEGGLGAVDTKVLVREYASAARGNQEWLTTLGNDATAYWRSLRAS